MGEDKMDRRGTKTRGLLRNVAIGCVLVPASLGIGSGVGSVTGKTLRALGFGYNYSVPEKICTPEERALIECRREFRDGYVNGVDDTKRENLSLNINLPYKYYDYINLATNSESRKKYEENLTR